MMRCLTIGPSFRPVLARSTEAGAIYFRFFSGTIGGMTPVNSCDKASPLEVGWKPAGIADAVRYVWLEIACGVGAGDYGVTISDVRFKSSEGLPDATAWPHYPSQWNFETVGKARIMVCSLATAANGDGWTIQPTRYLGKNLVLLAPIVQTCMVAIPIDEGGTYPGERPRGDSTDKRGFFFCEADPDDPTKPALFDPDGLLFT